MKSKVFGTFGDFRSRFGGSSQQQGGDAQQQGGSKVQSFLNSVVKEVKAAILPQTQHLSATRAPDEADLAAPVEHDPNAPTDLVLTEEQKSGFDKAYEQFKEKFGHHPIFQRMQKVNVQDTKVSRSWSHLTRDSAALVPSLGSCQAPCTASSPQ